jgi:colicin import membrane protein
MKKLVTVFVAVVALAFAACAKKATPDEVKKACAKLVELEKAATPAPVAEDAAVKINQDFAQKMQALRTAQGEALKAVDDECVKAKEALPKKAKADDVAKADEACNANKNAKAQEFAPQFAELNKQKVEALKAAADAKAKAEADAKAQSDKDLAACADKGVKDRTTKAKVDCQLKAAKLDDFNKCK